MLSEPVGMGMPLKKPLSVAEASRGLRHAAHVYHVASPAGRPAAQLALEAAALAFALAKLNEEG